MAADDSSHRSSCLATCVRGLTIDSMFNAIAGVVSLGLCFSHYQNTKIPRYKVFLIGRDNRDVIGISTFVIGCLGLINVILAVVRIRGSAFSSTRLHTNKYTMCVVMTLLGNFSLGLILTQYKGQLSDVLSATMKSYLRQTMVAQAALGVGFKSQDNWDNLQIQMRCCGVDSFEDYLVSNLSKRTIDNKKTVPMSCCGMRTTAEGYQEVDNVAQCVQDASRHIYDSVFLHTQGCHGPLTLWLTRHISVSTALIFLVISLQAVAVLYLSYRGYQSSAPPRGSRNR